MFILVVILSYIGISLLGSATHINVVESSSMYNSQQNWVLLGLITLVIFTFIDYNYFSSIYILLYLIGIILLLLTSFSSLGITVNGATRWLSFGGITLQPSEINKIFIIIFLSFFLQKYENYINTPLFIVAILAIILLPVLLIMLQPSLSASLVILFISSNLLFISGLKKRLIILAAVLAMTLGIFLLYDAFSTDYIIIDKILDDYQIARITGTFKADTSSDGFRQTNYAISAISSGQLYGKGLYNGTLNQLSYLAESHNDLIFAVLGEEFGFIGTTSVLFLIFLLISRCFIIGFQSPFLSGRLIASGVGAMIFFQAFINVGVNTGLIPNTGMPFPFLSYGGSSMIINMFNIGLVMSVNRINKKTK